MNLMKTSRSPISWGSPRAIQCSGCGPRGSCGLPPVQGGGSAAHTGAVRETTVGKAKQVPSRRRQHAPADVGLYRLWLLLVAPKLDPDGTETGEQEESGWEEQCLEHPAAESTPQLNSSDGGTGGVSPGLEPACVRVLCGHSSAPNSPYSRIRECDSET